NGADTLTVTDTVTGTSFGIDFTIDGSTLTAGQHLHVTKAGTGVANFAGGGGDDVFHFIGSILFGGDTVAAGGGTDVIQVDEGSVSNLGSGISDIAAIEVLANGPVATSSSTFVFLESGFGQGSIVVDSTALGTGKALFVVASDNGPAEVVDVRGGGGDDSIDGGDGADTIAGNGGNDVVSSAGGADSVSGGGGDDMLQGGDDDDWLGGGVGNDILSGGHGADTLVGGRGADFINAGATDGAVDVVYYGGLHQGGVAGSASGADTVTGFEAGTDKVIFRGGAGDELDDLGSDGALAFAVDAAADFDGAHEAALQTGFADADL